MMLSRRHDPSDIWEPGQFSIVEQQFEDIIVRTLCLACPSGRCCHITFTSHLVKILKEDPLTIEGNLACPNCGFEFHIENGESCPV